MIRFVSMVLLFVAAPAHYSFAQGTDSSPTARDRQVIRMLLPGTWDNNNQSYFDRRQKVAASEAHARLHIVIEVAGEPGRPAGDPGDVKFNQAERDRKQFELKLSWDNGATIAERWLLELSDGHDGVDMTVTDVATSSPKPCIVHWQREAAQFRGSAVADSNCARLPAEWVLSEDQLWLEPIAAGEEAPPESAHKLHRARAFTCYADIPGVGGGRDEPYERYGEFSTHDAGGFIRFSSSDEPERHLGISLSRVDWPLNNYPDVFTRDVLVLAIVEFLPDGVVKEHGYTFTEPGVERIGINLKWMLANCYIRSNADQVPFM